jgi:hypothetical protein
MARCLHIRYGPDFNVGDNESVDPLRYCYIYSTMHEVIDGLRSLDYDDLGPRLANFDNLIELVNYVEKFT